MNRIFSLFVAAVLLILSFAANAQDETPPPRKGFVLGLGAGWGNAGADLTVVEEIDRQNGVVGDLAVGWGVGSNVVVGFEFDIWSQIFQNSEWAFNLSSVGITYFPMGKNAHAAANIGVGTSQIKTGGPEGSTISQDGAGLGFAVAGGYEWCINKEVALGPKIKWTYLDIGGDVTNNADYLAVEIMLTWYKP
jgi:hypothetical protein